MALTLLLIFLSRIFLSSAQSAASTVADVFFYELGAQQSHIGTSVAIHEGSLLYSESLLSYATTEVYDLTSSSGWWGEFVNSGYSTDSSAALVSIYKGVAVAMTRGAPAAAQTSVLDPAVGWRSAATFNMSHFAWPADAGLAPPPTYTLRAVSMGDGALAFSGVRSAAGAGAAFVVTYVYTNASACGAAVCVPVAPDAGAAGAPRAAWRQMQILTAPEPDFGAAVAILGGVLVVGVPSLDAVRLFGWDGIGRSWVYNTTIGPFAVVSGAPLPAPGTHFGAAISLRERLVVGAPAGGPYTPPYTPDGNTGAAGAGAVFVFPSPVTSIGAGVYSQRTVPAGVVGGRLPNLCGVTGTTASAALGTSVDQDASEGTSTVASGMPVANKVLMFTVSASGVCTPRELVGLFYYPGVVNRERDTGVCVGFHAEMLYFGSPTASNALFAFDAAPGRLYAKAYCFQNRHILPVSVWEPYRRVCGWCPVGQYSIGGSGSTCSACSGLPPAAQWTGHGCSTWVCNPAHFGAACVVCSAYMAGLNVTAPSNSHWVDGAATCTWACNTGFLPVSGGCSPPPVPGMAPCFVASAVSWSTLRIAALPATTVSYAPLVSLMFNASRVNTPGGGAVSGVVARGAWLAPSAGDVAALALACNGTPAANVSNAVAAQVGGLSAQTAYMATVTFANAAGWGAPSAESPSFLTGPPVAPSAPQSLGAAGVSGSHMNLTWLASADSGGSAILAYDVCLGRNCSTLATLLASCQFSGVVPPSGTAQQSVLVAQLSAKTAYCAACRAVAAPGQSLWAFGGPFSTSTATVPSAPGGVSCSSGASTIALVWGAPLDNGGAAVSYSVSWTVNGSSSALGTRSSNGTSATISGLYAVTLYSIKVAARNSAGLGLGSQVFCSTLAAAAPSPPQNLHVQYSGASVVMLTWLAPADTGGLGIQYYTATVWNVGFAQAAQIIGLSGAVHNLTAATSYNATVTATNGIGTSESSMSITVATAPLQEPSPPLALTLKNASASSVLAVWSAPFDTGGGSLVQYNLRLFRTSNNATVSVTVVPATVSQALFAQLNATTAYSVSATVLSTVGVSAGAVGGPITTRGAVPPSGPQNLTCTTSWSTVTFRWAAPVDSGGAPVSYYYLRWSRNSSTPLANWTALRTPGASLGIVGVAAASSYWFGVSAVNTAGSSSTIRASSGCYTQPAVVPSAPFALNLLSVGASTATITWTAPADNGGATILYYNATASVAGGGGAASPLRCGSRGTKCAIGGLLGNTSYTVVVSATNAVGVGALCAPFVFATLLPRVPGPPGSPFLLSAMGGALVVSFPPSSDDGGRPVLAYTLLLTQDTLHYVTAAVVTGTSGTAVGLSASSAYYFMVTASNAIGSSSASALSAVMWTTAVTPPSQPSSVAVSNISWSSATVLWVPPPDLGGVGVASVSYHVTIQSAVDNSTVVTLSAARSPSVVSGIYAGTAYICTVVAQNSGGAGVGSAVTFTTGSPVTPRAPPSPVLAQAGGSMLLITMRPPTDNGGLRILGYVASLLPIAAGGPAVVLRTNQTTVLFTGLWAVSAYSITTAAVNAVGTGAFGVALVTGTGLPTPPASPVGLACLSVSPTAAVVVWGAPQDNGGANLTSYDVFVSTSAASLGTLVLLPANVTSWGASGLAAATAYFVRVRANSVAGAGVMSAPLAINTTPAVPPAATASPVVVAVDCCSAKFAVSQTPNSGGAPALYYAFQLWSASGSPTQALRVATAPPGTTNWTWPALPANSGYTMRAAAANIVGLGAWSTFSAAAVTLSPDVPGTPTNVLLVIESSVVAGFCSVVLQWAAPLSDGGAPCSYVVDLKNGSGITLNHTDVSGLAPLELVMPVAQTGVAAATVTATNSAGIGASFVTAALHVDAACFGAPPAPAAPALLAVTSSTVAVLWSVPTLRSPSQVQLVLTSAAVPPAAAVAVLLPVASTNYTFVGLMGATPFAVTLAAVNSAGVGVPSAKLNVVTLAAVPPAAPGAPTPVQIGASDVAVQWSPPTDTGGAAIVAYVVRASNASGSVCASALTMFTSSDLFGLLAKSSYRFSVAAVSAAGTGAFSSWSVVVVTAAVGKPSAPLSVFCVAVASSQLTVQWTAPADSGGDPNLMFTVYLQQRTKSTDPFLPSATLVVNASLQVSFLGLTGATYYSALITASNAAGVSPMSAASPVVQSGAPIVPSIVLGVKVANQSSTTLSVTWQPPLDAGGSAVQTYVACLFAAQASSAPLESNAVTSTSFVFRSLAATTTYWVGVAARNAVGAGPASAAVKGTTLAATLPSSPGVPVVVGVGPYWVDLNVSTPSDNGGTPVTQFLVHIVGSAMPHQFPASAGPMRVGSLNGSAVYVFTAAAVSAVGRGPASGQSLAASTIPAVVPGAPPAPTVTGMTYSAARLAWHPPLIDGGSAVTNYRVSYSVDGVAFCEPVVVGLTLQATIPGLHASTRYFFRIQAANSVGWSALASPSSLVAFTAPAVIASAPRNFAATLVGRSVLRLNFSPPADSGGQGVLCYIVQTWVHASFLDACGVVGFSANAGSVINGLGASVSFSGELASAPFHINSSYVAMSPVSSYQSLPCSNATLVDVPLLTPGSIVAARVQAVTADPGTSDMFGVFSNVSVGFGPAWAPASPQAPAVTAVGSTYVTLQVQLGGSGGCTVLTVQLWRRVGTSTGNWSLIASVLPVGVSLTIVDAGARRATAYQYAAIQVTGLGASPMSASTAVTTQTTPPSPPASLSVAAGGSTRVMIPLVWAPPADDGGSSVLNYILYSLAGASGTPIYSGANLKFNVTGLRPLTSMSFCVVANTGVGASECSAHLTASTTPALPCPGNCTYPNGACLGIDGVCTCSTTYQGPSCAAYNGATLLLDVECAPAAWDPNTFKPVLANIMGISATRLILNVTGASLGRALSEAPTTLHVTCVILNVDPAAPAAPAVPSGATIAAAFLALAAADSPLIAGAGILQVGTGSSPGVPILPPNCTRASCTSCTSTGGCGWCAMTGSCVVGGGTGPSVGSGFTPSTCPVYFSGQPPAAMCPAACATLLTCETCMARPDCSFCQAQARCVPAYATSSEMCTSNWMVVAAQCPSVRCPAYSSCTPCTLDPSCGYCSLNRKCVPGNAFGPLGGASCAASIYFYGGCAGTCGSYGDCASCEGAPLGCGWCGGVQQCVKASGDGSSPASGGCPAQWITAPNTCPATPAQVCAALSSSCDSCLSTAHGCGFCPVGPGSCALAGSAGCSAPTVGYCIDACAPEAVFQVSSGSFHVGSAGNAAVKVLHTYSPGARCSFLIAPPPELAGTSVTITANVAALNLAPGDVLSFYDSTSAKAVPLAVFSGGNGGGILDPIVSNSGVMFVTLIGVSLATRSPPPTGFLVQFSVDSVSGVSTYVIIAATVACVSLCLCIVCFCCRCRRQDDVMGGGGVEMQRVNRGVDPRVLNSIPSFVYYKRLAAQMPLYIDEGEESTCAICLEVFDDGSKLRVLPCRHGFHVTCIDQWLGINLKCPLCKRDVAGMVRERSAALAAGLPDTLACGPEVPRLSGEFAVDQRAGGGGRVPFVVMNNEEGFLGVIVAGGGGGGGGGGGDGLPQQRVPV